MRPPIIVAVPWVIEMADPTTSAAVAGDATAEQVIDRLNGRSVLVCFPCKNEAETIGPLVSAVHSQLVKKVPLVTELVVMDDGSTDGTARIATEAGANVFDVGSVTVAHSRGQGKGNVLWASLLATSSELCVWCDGDLRSFSPDWIPRLLAPLVDDPNATLVKATYTRPESDGGGGRTTELVARPLLSIFHPSLAALGQPLSGEFAARRSAMEQIPFVQGWGVEVAMLIDLAERFGAGSILQTDLGIRRHRHHPLQALSKQAAEVAATILQRNGAVPDDIATVDDGAGGYSDRLTLTKQDGSTTKLNLAERPPLIELR